MKKLALLLALILIFGCAAAEGINAVYSGNIMLVRIADGEYAPDTQAIEVDGIFTDYSAALAEMRRTLTLDEYYNTLSTYRKNGSASVYTVEPTMYFEGCELISTRLLDGYWYLVYKTEGSMRGSKNADCALKTLSYSIDKTKLIRFSCEDRIGEKTIKISAYTGSSVWQYSTEGLKISAYSVGGINFVLITGGAPGEDAGPHKLCASDQTVVFECGAVINGRELYASVISNEELDSLMLADDILFVAI